MSHVKLPVVVVLEAARCYLSKRASHLANVEANQVSRLIQKSTPGVIGRFFGRDPWSKEKATQFYRDSIQRKFDHAVGVRWEREARALIIRANVAHEKGIDEVALDVDLADVFVRWKAFAGEEEVAS
ncbi:hypothetical protein WJ97_11340 [Burkholderia ubonensis]|uniref:hypothetical protein n=1 Tax=Burkholderia ubonensis TaxID=101571 RepID=UPI000759389D|nr:hypothetical protein [Burkholderia ubonensis]KVP96476.1 hypothetical protein WJ97_11340 [Burkholderia ubonensis]